MRPELRELVDALLKASEDSREVTLDALGDAIGTRAVTHDEIDAMIGALEAQGRRVVGASGAGEGEARLRAVVAAARDLRASLGRTPTAREIADKTGLDLDAVKHALALARVMQR
jgi:hypothetical protein